MRLWSSLCPSAWRSRSGSPGEERTEEMAGVSAVWSLSPCSLLVVDRRLRASGQDELAAVRIKPSDEPEAVTVRLDRRGPQGITTPGGATAERVDVIVDGRRTKALIRPDLPLSAEGWFELLG